MGYPVPSLQPFVRRSDTEPAPPPIRVERGVPVPVFLAVVLAALLALLLAWAPARGQAAPAASDILAADERQVELGCTTIG